LSAFGQFIVWLTRSRYAERTRQTTTH